MNNSSRDLSARKPFEIVSHTFLIADLEAKYPLLRACVWVLINNQLETYSKEKTAHEGLLDTLVIEVQHTKDDLGCKIANSFTATIVGIPVLPHVEHLGFQDSLDSALDLFYKRLLAVFSINRSELYRCIEDVRTSPAQLRVDYGINHMSVLKQVTRSIRSYFDYLSISAWPTCSVYHYAVKREEIDHKEVDLEVFDEESINAVGNLLEHYRNQTRPEFQVTREYVTQYEDNPVLGGYDYHFELACGVTVTVGYRWLKVEERFANLLGRFYRV